MKLSELPGVGPVTEEKLAKFGITDVSDLMIYSPREVSEMTGMDSESAASIFLKAKEALLQESKIGKLIVKGTDILEERKTAEIISTGTKALDKLFLGGLETKATTEVYGEFGSGKSQFCHTMAVRTQLPKERGGLGDCKVAWIDTEETFRPERITQISNKLNLDPELILNNIFIARVHNTVEQKLALEQLAKLIISENIKLIVIDSVMGLFRAEYIGRGSLSDRQGQLNKFVDLASHIARFYKIAIIFTNQVQSDPGQTFGDPTKPIGGNVLAHTSTYRVYFKKSGDKRIARMVDSPLHPYSEVMFALSTSGVVDLETKEEEDKAEKKALKKKEKEE